MQRHANFRISTSEGHSIIACSSIRRICWNGQNVRQGPVFWVASRPRLTISINQAVRSFLGQSGMASNSKWPRSDTQSYTPQGHKSSAMSNATCWDYFSNDGLGFFDYQGSRRSSHPRQTTEEKLSRSFQQCTPFAEPRVPSPSPCAILDERLNKSDPSYPMIRGSQDYTASSSTETRRRTGTEDYPTQAWQYPPMAEDQSWKQNLGYSGQQQRFEEYYLHSSQPTQSDSYPTDFGDIYHPQQYSSSHAPSSYLDNNRMPSIASLGRSPYHALMMPVARPSIVVDEAQDNHICSLEEPAEGKLSVPRAPRRGQRDVDSQRRRRHLTPEGREHAKDVRKVHACKDCRRRKIKVCLVWSSGFALVLILPKS